MDAASTGGSGEHLDEGTIHAWLDDALDGPEASAVAMHVMSCAQCTAAVAEARGLIAGASRVVRALDDDATTLPAAPAWGTPTAAAARGSRWWSLRVTPARAAIAATLLVALGVTLTYPRSAVQETAILQSRVPATVSAPTMAPPRDSLLESAIKRNVAAAQPPRAVGPASSTAIPQAPPPTVAARLDTVAPERVAEGRMATRALRDSSAPAADQSRANVGQLSKVAVVASADARSSQGSSANSVSSVVVPETYAAAGSPLASRAPLVALPATGGPQCYRVESTVPGTRFGPVALPFTVTLQPATGAQRGVGVIVDPRSGDASTTVVWSRTPGDTLDLKLRRIGYSGELTLAAGGQERSGTMRSSQLQTALEEVVTTGVASPVDSLPAAAAQHLMKKRARPAGAAGRAPAERDSLAARESMEAKAKETASAVPVVARVVGCPKP